MNVGVTRKMKNRQYKYQYGEAGFKNNVSNSPPISLFTDSEKKVFNSHVAKLNVKYGTPNARTFLNTFLPQLWISFTLLNLW